MVEKRRQKASQDERAILEIEIHPNPALDENRAGRGTGGNANRRLTSESTPVEQGHEQGLLIDKKFRNYPIFQLKTRQWESHLQTTP